MIKRKRAYFVQEYDGECGHAIVANSAKAAKLAIHYTGDFSGEFIDLRVKWIKKISSKKLRKFKVGHIFDGLIGLKLGVYAFVEDTCPICKKDKTVYNNESFIGCLDCYENSELDKECVKK